MNKKASFPPLVFFGTPEFAKYSLAYLIKAGFPILAVVTAPDRKSGRGKKITTSAVKDYALSRKITVLQPINLNSTDFINKLQELNAEIYAVVAFRILPKIVWSIPALGTINLHASLLPNYKGAAPINWVLINGEKETGVTTFLINGEIDSGALLMRESIQIHADYNFEILHDKLLKIGAPLLSKTLLKLSSKSLIAKRQEELEHLKMAPKLNSENTCIQWNNPLDAILNQIRGLSPYPGAWTILNNDGEYLRIKIFDAETLKILHSHDKGQVVKQDFKLMIATTDGYLICKEIQLPNKKRMSVSALLNGYSIGSNARIH
tara:strand:+ start:1047 stop:2006 length:960 start_codon:yes stop_codon:yes gene_type:complete